jgi:Icc-related predicted phosphoesterase
LSTIFNWLRVNAAGVDAIVYAGDDLNRFHKNGGNYLQLFAVGARHGVFAVAGNDDEPSSRGYIRGDNVYNVHAQPVEIGDFVIIGQEGVENRPDRANPGQLIYKRERIEERLRSLLDRVGDKQVIIVSHAPPAGCLDRALRFRELDHVLSEGEQSETSRGIGSRALTSIIEDYDSIRLVVCGHVHKMGGKSRMFGNAVVANAASHDHEGAPVRIGHATVSRDGTVDYVSWTEVSDSYTTKVFDSPEERKAARELKKLPGVGKKTATRLLDCGIDSIESLAEADVADLKSEIHRPGRSWETIVARAKAHYKGRPVLISSPQLPTHPRIYLDIETDLNPKSLVWLVGVHVHGEEDVRGFYAETPNEEQQMLSSFLEFLRMHPDATLLHYSTNRFDERILKHRLIENNLPVPEQLETSIDVGLLAERSIAMPTEGYTLSDVAGHAGYEFTYPSMAGDDVASIYMNCIDRGEVVPDKVFEYNRDDVLAVRSIVEWMEGLK